LRGGGNEKDSAGKGVMGMTEHKMAAGNENGLCGEGRMRKTVLLLNELSRAELLILVVLHGLCLTRA
jgi:hypothetical protein